MTFQDFLLNALRPMTICYDIKDFLKRNGPQERPEYYLFLLIVHTYEHLKGYLVATAICRILSPSSRIRFICTESENIIVSSQDLSEGRSTRTELAILVAPVTASVCVEMHSGNNLRTNFDTVYGSTS